MRRVLRLGLAASLLAMLALGLGFLSFLSQAAAPVVAPGRRTDAIVVLTGGADRVETALRLLDEGLAPRLLVSGANTDLTLAELARAHGRDPAALEGRVILGRLAASTRGNAAEVAAYARAQRIGSIRVVTAGYHMPRALLELRRAAPGLRLLPHPVTPAALRAEADPPPRARTLPAMRRWTLLPGEYLKYVAAAAGLTHLLPAKESAIP
jgi:uncharacterized SAM-binding protein YcdF (DUF218 family)